MKLSSRFNLARRKPKAFAIQLLLSMLAGSLVPLLLLSAIAGQTVRSQLQRSSQLSAERTEMNYIRMYENHIEEQAQSIDSELRKVESAVLVAKAMAEALFSKPSAWPETFVEYEYDEAENRYVDLDEDGKGMVSIRVESREEKPTAEQTRDFAIGKNLHPVFRAQTANNPNIVTMYYIHPQSGSYVYPFYDGPPAPDSRPIRKLTTYPFYTDALIVPPGVDEVVWTKPYYDITPRGWMFTATTPVYDDKRRLRGIVAADVTVDSFIGNVVDTNFDTRDGYALLLDSHYTLIAAQQHGLYEINRMNLISAFRSSRPQDGRQYRIMELSGENKAVFSRSIPSTHWTLGYIIAERTLLEPVYSATKELNQRTERALTLQLALLCGLAVMLSIALAFFLRARIARPVDRLAEAFAKMGEGKVAVTHHDTRVLEFNRLLHDFNRMSGKVSELMEAQAALNADLEHKVRLRTAELKEMNDELEMRVRELTRLEQWRKELFMNISHDLKTPITLIQGYIEAIHEGVIPEEQTGFYLRRIRDGIAAITHFVRSLNELSLLETRQLAARMEPLDATELFRAIASKWAPYMELAGRPFRIERLSGGAPLLGDAHLLGRVLDNLIENALKYTEERLPVAFRYELAEGAAKFSVIDAGPGIPEDAIPYVFNSFYRVDKSRNSGIPGSGLGLSIAKEIAAMHGGELSVDVRRGEGGSGCTFALSLPLRQEAGAASERRTEAPPADEYRGASAG
ncbi:ATP-binding protein [Paenibacillus thailandensis]|uniref:histidine kinase n=1 Tax=Paenibacillus thailandensis TaxID=393250 RepID=A0ABW5QVU7_9BACL